MCIRDRHPDLRHEGCQADGRSGQRLIQHGFPAQLKRFSISSFFMKRGGPCLGAASLCHFFATCPLHKSPRLCYDKAEQPVCARQPAKSRCLYKCLISLKPVSYTHLDVYKRQLCNPVEIHANDEGFVKSITCIEMELGEPDASGRRRPIEKKGSEFELDVDLSLIHICG